MLMMIEARIVFINNLPTFLTINFFKSQTELYDSSTGF